MKAKTIKNVLRAQFDLWLKSITDEEVRATVKNNTMITGGSIVSMLQGDKVNDYDLYFRNRQTALEVAEYYAKQVPLANVEIKLDVDASGRKAMPGNISIRVNNPSAFQQESEFADEVPEATNKVEGKYSPVYMSSNAITLSDGIQLICRFYGEPEQIHSNYDFIHCTCYWKSWDDELVLPQAALESILTKELRYVGSKYPLCSIIRIRKFMARQWTINAGQILKMVMQLQELDLKDIATLQDQLVGVDSAYFSKIIHLLQEQNVEKVDAGYLMTIIDRVF